MNSSIIYKYFPNLSDKQKKQFDQLGELYNSWNQKINVISRKDMASFYERHVLHSLAVAKYISFSAESKILDVGTGGGFPGIPLAILMPEVQFHLVDSVGKKIKVVTAISETLGLKNLTAEHQRMEQLIGSYDFVVSRAVAQTQQLLKWTKHLISDDHRNELGNGWLLLKGGDLSEELTVTKKEFTICKLPEWFDGEFFETKQLIWLGA